jgi:siroheme synthase
MGSHEAPAISAALIAGGRAAATPVAIVEDASLPGSRVPYTTLGGLRMFANASLGGPTLLLVGPQFRARTQLAREDNDAGPDAGPAALPDAAHG